VFELGRSSKHYDLQSGCILPFLEDEEGGRKSGGYGSVWRVKIHPEHQRWSEDLETERASQPIFQRGLLTNSYRLVVMNSQSKDFTLRTRKPSTSRGMR
jgi:hypothetical protein